MIIESSARWGGVRTRVLSVTGGGTTFLLLHGFSDSADTWRGVLTEFERHGRAAVALDLQGFGDADPLSPGTIVDQLDRFLDGVLATYDGVHLMGNSLGACLAVRAATRDTDGVIRSVVTLDEPALADHWLARYARRVKEPWGFRVARSPLPIPRVALRWARRRALGNLFGSHATAVPVVAIARWAQAVPDYRAAGKMLVAARNVGLETAGGYDGLDRIRCPLLILHGAKDRIIPVSSSMRLHRAVPGSELRVLPGSGHCPQLDDPIGVTGLALRFATG